MRISAISLLHVVLCAKTTTTATTDIPMISDARTVHRHATAFVDTARRITRICAQHSGQMEIRWTVLFASN